MSGQKSKNYNIIPWEDILYYDETSPTFLRWKIYIKVGKHRNVNLVSPNDVAGKIDNQGYVQVGYNSKTYLGHRIVWILNNKSIDDSLYIDHIDRDKSNNRIENLRLVTDSINNRNARIGKNNSTGVSGVHWLITRGKTYAVATWYGVEGKQCCKWFSSSKYGVIPSFCLAVEYRINKINELNSIGFGYTSNHREVSIEINNQLADIAPSIFEITN